MATRADKPARRLAALATTMLLTVACGHTSSHATVPARDVFALWHGGGAATSYIATDGNLVMVYTPVLAEAKKDVVLIDAVAAHTVRGIQTAAARVLYLFGPRSDHANPPMGGCTSVWPPAGYGPSHPLHGAKIRKGDIIALMLYIRGDPKFPGDWKTTGTTITFEVGGRKFKQTLGQSGMVLSVRRTPAEYPLDKDGSSFECPSEPQALYFSKWPLETTITSGS